MIGQTISHYRITAKLGGGGMGVVYRAEDTTLKRTVALKFLPPDLTRDEEAKQRFIHEAQAASALQHENICTIHDIGETPDGQLFMVMDHYKGETLRKKIESGVLGFEEAIDIALQIARGLGKAHEKGIVHRDIKPANILVTDEGVVKIVDFGLVKLLGAQQITQAGRALGTTAYMSPEQLKGEEVDARTDIWSFGVVLYQMMTGQLPFRAEFEEAVIYQINCEQPPPVGSLRPDLPKNLCLLIARCLEKQKQNRPRSMGEIERSLGFEQHPRSLRWPFAIPGRIMFYAGAAVLSLALILYFAGDLEFAAPPTELHLAVLTFIDETKDTSIAGYKPEIQRLFVKELHNGKNLIVEDRLRLNDMLAQEFGTDSPPRTEALYNFLRGRRYDFVVDGGVTSSPAGGHAIQVNLNGRTEEFLSGEEFEGRLQASSCLDSVVRDLCSQMLAYLKVNVLDVKSEMGVWKRNRPKSWPAVAKLEDAYSYYCANERGLANSALVEAVRLDSTFISPRIWLASYQRRSDPGGARRNLQALLALRSAADPFERAMIDWVSAFLDHSTLGQVRALEKALRFDPTNRVLLANLAGAFTEMRDTLRALDAYAYCVKSRWEFKPFYPVVVRYYLALRNWDAAKEALLIWRDVDSTEISPSIYGWLSAIELRKGNTAEGTRWRDRVLMMCMDSSTAKTSYLLGSCYLDAGLTTEGETLLSAAVSLEQRNGEYRERLADAFLARGDSVAAVIEYTEASQRNPRSRGVILKLGYIFKQKGDRSRAREQFHKYLELDSLSYDAKEIQRWMKTTVD